MPGTAAHCRHCGGAAGGATIGGTTDPDADGCTNAECDCELDRVRIACGGPARAASPIPTPWREGLLLLLSVFATAELGGSAPSDTLIRGEGPALTSPPAGPAPLWSTAKGKHSSSLMM